MYILNRANIKRVASVYETVNRLSENSCENCYSIFKANFSISPPIKEKYQKLSTFLNDLENKR